MNTVAGIGDNDEPRMSGKPVKSALRVLEILEFVAMRGAVTLADVVADLQFPRSSAHSLLVTLETQGWLRRDRGGQFRLGLRAQLLGRSKSAGTAWLDALDRTLASITRATGETAQFSVLEDTECVYVAVHESPQPMSLFSRVGSRLHAHATAAGKAMIAQLEPAERARTIGQLGFERLTAHTIDSADSFEVEIEQTALAGFAIEVEEYVPNSCCVAMSVDLRASIGVLGAVSITMPKHRQPADWPTSLVPVLTEHVRSLVGELGASS